MISRDASWARALPPAASPRFPAVLRPIRQWQAAEPSPAALRCRAAGKDDDGPGAGTDSLTATLKRKQEQLNTELAEFSSEQLYERLGGQEIGELAQQGSEHRFAGLIPEVRFREGRPVVVVELQKATPSTSPQQLAQLARELEAAGIDALAVPTDSLDTSTGLADLLSVCRAVKCPVVRRDWILHPIQIREAKEAGAAGVMGIVTSVLGKNAVLLSSYAASLGLDCPVEVVNTQELGAMEAMGVPFFGCNLGVGLALAVPGLRTDVARGLLGEMAHGNSSIVGVTSLQEAVKATHAGADMVFVKKEWLAAALPSAFRERDPTPGGRVEAPSEFVGFVSELKYAMSGDD